MIFCDHVGLGALGEEEVLFGDPTIVAALRVGVSDHHIGHVAEFCCRVANTRFDAATVGAQAGETLGRDAVAVVLCASEFGAGTHLFRGVGVGGFLGFHANGHVAFTSAATHEVVELALELNRANLFSCHNAFVLFG